MARPKLGRSASGKKANGRSRNAAQRASPPPESLSYPPAPAPDEGMDDLASMRGSDRHRPDSTATGTGQWSVFQNEMSEETLDGRDGRDYPRASMRSDSAESYGTAPLSIRRFESPRPDSLRSNSASSFGPSDGRQPYGGQGSAYGSDSTLVPDSASALQYGDSASNYYMDNEKLGPVGANTASFLAVPDLRQRQGDSVMAGGPGAFVGGFDPTSRFSSAHSVASTDREATSDAWIKRQKIKPGRAKTKRVKLTKGRFITEYGEAREYMSVVRALLTLVCLLQTSHPLYGTPIRQEAMATWRSRMSSSRCGTPQREFFRCHLLGTWPDTFLATAPATPTTSSGVPATPSGRSNTVVRLTS